MSETTALNLMQASSSSFSARCFSAVPGGHQVRALCRGPDYADAGPGGQGGGGGRAETSA
jgi:hypothetical protein